MTEQTKLIPDAPKRKRVITDPAKSVWVARATKAEMDLHERTLERDYAKTVADQLRESLQHEVRSHMTGARIAALVALFAAAAFVAGVVAGKAVFG